MQEIHSIYRRDDIACVENGNGRKLISLYNMNDMNDGKLIAKLIADVSKWYHGYKQIHIMSYIVYIVYIEERS